MQIQDMSISAANSPTVLILPAFPPPDLPSSYRLPIAKMTPVDSDSSMRFFRRSLLCFVVGVTAFGASGWGFRPQPLNTVVVPMDTMTLTPSSTGTEVNGQVLPNPSPFASAPAFGTRSCLGQSPDWPEGTTERLFEQRGALRLWLAYPALSTSFWIGVDDGRQPILEWKRYPADVAIRPFMPPCIADPTFLPRMIAGQPAAMLFTTGHGIVVVATELSPSSALPEGIVAMLPDDSDLFRTHVVARWYDLKSKRWSDTGARDFWDFDIVNGKLVTLAMDGKDRAKQSWPLPPRDPKWPALGIAIACSVGTWWVSAWRYRRKVKRATLAAVTA